MLNIQEVKKEFNFSCKTIPHATHQPVLYTICNKPNLTILEFGCGMFSTGLLTYMDAKLKHNIITFENDNNWINTVKNDLQYNPSNRHQFIYIDDWNSLFNNNILKLLEKKYDVVFIDQAPWEARELTLAKLNMCTDYVVIHDSDFCPGYNINYDNYLKNYKIFMPLEPYPYKSGPPTLLGSNFCSCDIDINYGDFL